MTYPIVQTAVADVIKKILGFDDRNVAEMDHRALAVGVEKAVILRRGNSGTPDSGQQDFIGGDQFRYVRRDDWVINCELYVPFRTDVRDLRASINTETQLIKDQLDKWPNLDGVADTFDVSTDIIGEPVEWLISDQRWFMQLIVVNVHEQSEVLVKEVAGGRIYRYGDAESVYGTAVFR